MISWFEDASGVVPCGGTTLWKTVCDWVERKRCSFIRFIVTYRLITCQISIEIFLRDARLLRTRLVNVIVSEQSNLYQQHIASLPAERQADAFSVVLDQGREALDTLQAAIEDETSEAPTEELL
ncbi:hypothetical protein Ddc_19091 [Ditylenchus destructor]|nr:hypothetical protein Ddc_19091 [Ditylenchus destructor]